MAIQPPTKADFDSRAVSICIDLQTGTDRYNAFVTAWSNLGQTGQTALGYSADDIAAVNALISFLGAVNTIYGQASPYTAPGGTAPLTNSQLFAHIVPFALPR